MRGCLAPYIITFYRLGAEGKERIIAKPKISFFLQKRPSLQAVLVEVLRKHMGGKPHTLSDPQAWVQMKWCQQNRNQVGVDACSVIW